MKRATATRRILKLALACLALLLVLAPDASAQKKHKGGGGKRAGGALHAGANKGRRGGGGARKSTTSIKTGALKDAPTGPGPSGFGELSKEAKASEKRFQELLNSIDKAIAEADQRAKEAVPAESSAIPLPRDLAPGSDSWNELQRPIFEACDRDATGWISFREAHDSLGLDRAEYLLYDRDHDGRVGSREFMTRYDEVVQATGVFPIPRPIDDSAAIVPRSPRQLAAAFDTNGDGALDVSEIAQMLSDYDREEIDPKLAVARLDDDSSGKIDGEEIAQLSRLVSAAFLLPEARASARKKGSTHAAEELFCEVTEREGTHDETSLPPRISGPVTHFRRLDLDGDGYVTSAELQALQSPLTLAARSGAVLAALDADEDNRISRKEFLDSLRPAR